MRQTTGALGARLIVLAELALVTWSLVATECLSKTSKIKKAVSALTETAFEIGAGAGLDVFLMLLFCMVKCISN